MTSAQYETLAAWVRAQADRVQTHARGVETTLGPDQAARATTAVATVLVSRTCDVVPSSHLVTLLSAVQEVVWMRLREGLARLSLSSNDAVEVLVSGAEELDPLVEIELGMALFTDGMHRGTPICKEDMEERLEMILKAGGIGKRNRHECN